MIDKIQLSMKTYNKSGEEYFTIKQQIFARLIEIGIAFREVLYTKDKGDFSVLNVLVSFKSKNPIEIISYFNPKQILCNLNKYYSFDYTCNNSIEPFHINFIDVQNLDMALFYLSYNIVSSILSCIALSIGLDYSIDGLTVSLLKNATLCEDKRYKNIEILLSNNPEDICNFLGLNYSNWIVGFDNQNDIFEWVTKSMFFQPNYFKTDTFNSRRCSHKKKVVITEFRNYIETRIKKSEYDEIVPYMNLQKTAIGYFDKIDTYIELTHTK